MNAAVVAEEGTRVLLLLGRIAFGTALALFIVVLFFLLRREASNGNNNSSDT